MAKRRKLDRWEDPTEVQKPDPVTSVSLVRALEQLSQRVERQSDLIGRQALAIDRLSLAVRELTQKVGGGLVG